MKPDLLILAINPEQMITSRGCEAKLDIIKSVAEHFSPDKYHEAWFIDFSNKSRANDNLEGLWGEARYNYIPDLVILIQHSAQVTWNWGIPNFVWFYQNSSNRL